ncbi:P antigen family member 3-like [Desmodus rotundus]|uniref:P antigen family member 3-like n=1 Tax=Desmodus rotundus TaxID=9430 RepID=UPI002381102C|nr:P antigen family member 3-like [Desmodus rotundus]
MSVHIRSQSIWKKILQHEESSQTVGLGVSQQPSDEQHQQEEPPAESQDTTPDHDKDAWHLRFRILTYAGPDPEAVLQGEDQPKTGGEDKDGPGVKGKTLPKLQHVYMPEQLQTPAAPPVVPSEGQQDPDTRNLSAQEEGSGRCGQDELQKLVEVKRGK